MMSTVGPSSSIVRGADQIVNDARDFQTEDPHFVNPPGKFASPSQLASILPGPDKIQKEKLFALRPE
jgi:hypothetical protein